MRVPKWCLGLFMAFTFLFTNPAKADLFGGDVVVLSQILVQTIQQLAQLRQIFQTGKDTIGLMRDINRGINDSLALMRTISPNSDPGLYKELDKIQDVLRTVEQVYGV